MTTTHRDPDHHRDLAERRNQAHERKKARATGRKGLVIVHTGAGKGKSSAAFGMALRAIGHGMRVGVVQFIKGAMPTAERALLPALGDVRFETLGDGFTWHTQDLQRDLATARRAWGAAAEMLADTGRDMVILDELNVVLRYRYLPVDEVLAALAARPPLQHVIVTGRGAPDELIAAADLVSEFRNVKHPFKDQGIQAQPGVEY